MPTYDTYIELVPAAEQRVSRKTFRYGFKRHIGVKGFQKLINRWIKCFLTMEGTDPSDPDYGTLIPNLIGSNVTSRKDVVEALQLAVDKTNETILRLQAARPSDDPMEMLADARLEALAITPAGDGFEADVRVRNQAGQVLTAQIPPLTLTEG